MGAWTIPRAYKLCEGCRAFKVCRLISCKTQRIPRVYKVFKLCRACKLCKRCGLQACKEVCRACKVCRAELQTRALMRRWPTCPQRQLVCRNPPGVGQLRTLSR